jgi:hypothetical protein
VRALLWERTHALAARFDSQGISNMLWSFGQLRRKNGEAFAIRSDVLGALTAVVQRRAGTFAIQASRRRAGCRAGCRAGAGQGAC